MRTRMTKAGNHESEQSDGVAAVEPLLPKESKSGAGGRDSANECPRQTLKVRDDVLERDVMDWIDKARDIEGWR
jgi:hypothetical protein